MQVAIPKELKDNERRVAMTPAGVHELTRRGHDVTVELDAGIGAGCSNDEYVAAGAALIADADKLWAETDLIVKVKEPVKQEFHRLREGLTLFTYLHLAAAPDVADAILSSKTTAIAYETVTSPDGSLPLLAPMSEVAGRLAAQVGAQLLADPQHGPGLLLGGVPGVEPAKVTVIGGGVAGMHAAQIAVGMGAEVTVLDVSAQRLRWFDQRYRGQVRTLMSNSYSIESSCVNADVIIGTVLVPGARTPSLVSRELVTQLKENVVLVDVAIDQGGCFEDSVPTTYSDPTYRVGNAIFYCVANMPGAVPKTSTQALANATTPYVVSIAENGWQDAMRQNQHLLRGLNAHDGQLTNVAAANALGYTPTELSRVL